VKRVPIYERAIARGGREHGTAQQSKRLRETRLLRSGFAAEQPQVLWLLLSAARANQQGDSAAAAAFDTGLGQHQSWLRQLALKAGLHSGRRGFCATSPSG
jgi:hypothetical protein